MNHAGFPPAPYSPISFILYVTPFSSRHIHVRCANGQACKIEKEVSKRASERASERRRRGGRREGSRGEGKKRRRLKKGGRMVWGKDARSLQGATS
eukprot:1920577-Rhodomonas_salina.2